MLGTETPPLEPSPTRRPDRRVWLVFADLMANRAFFECGVVDALRAALPERLAAVFLVGEKNFRQWLPRLEGIPVLADGALLPVDVPLGERVLRRLDFELDRRVGFYPLAIRHSLRHGFHRGRWQSGHPFPFLDIDRVGRLPRWRVLEPALASWHFSRRRHVPRALLERLRRDCDALVVVNPQTHAAMPFLTAARRLGLPTVGYIASWDHPVGKGLVSPYLDRYVVQNQAMLEDLGRFHGIDGDRVTVTGWPQSDVYHRRRDRERYRRLLRELALDPERPVVLYAGNSPNNAPYEGRLVERLVAWWREGGAQDRFSLLFRPHPYDRDAHVRFSAARGVEGAAVQERRFDDVDELATLLQHVDCVVVNAGTFMLEALLNDRPTVCVTFDEGAGMDGGYAKLQLEGEHYRVLAASRAFYRAGDFEELLAGVDRALRDPNELAGERRRVVREVVGVVDGEAVSRVVASIVEVVSDVGPRRSGSRARGSRRGGRVGARRSRGVWNRQAAP